ncbi:hypothetical protein AU504_06855 [Lonsdalea populi]|nr:hypothetical protein AU504_06855 [Lonsdalea populi]RAT77087.1 hypothetical protein AU506_03625 [Lonsdalea populi]
MNIRVYNRHFLQSLNLNRALLKRGDDPLFGNTMLKHRGKPPHAPLHIASGIAGQHAPERGGSSSTRQFAKLACFQNLTYPLI